MLLRGLFIFFFLNFPLYTTICTRVTFSFRFDCPLQKERTDIGYNPIKEQYSTKNAKVEAINRFLRLRKYGDKIPPPFPNGWFCVALSSDVKNGQVRSVDVLGIYTLLEALYKYFANKNAML